MTCSPTWLVTLVITLMVVVALLLVALSLLTIQARERPAVRSTPDTTCEAVSWSIAP